MTATGAASGAVPRVAASGVEAGSTGPGQPKASSPRALPRGDRRKLVVLVVSAILVIGWRSWRPAWSGDEAATVSVVRRALTEVLLTWEHDPALTPYYLAMEWWSAPSTSEPWLRLSSVLAMAAAVVAVWYLAAQLGGRRRAAVTAAAVLVLPGVSRYGQEARPYALAVLLVVLAVVIWDDDRISLSRRRPLLLAAAIGLAGAAHPYALLVGPVLVTTSLLAPRRDRRREALTTAAAAAGALLLLSPFLYAVATRAGGQPNPPQVTVAAFAEELLRLPVSVLSPPLALPFACAALALATTGVFAAWLGGEHRLVALTGSWLLLPPLALCVVQLATGAPGLVARYWVISVPALALAMGYALDVMWPRSRVIALGILSVLILLALPTHLSLRSVDGHLGHRWRSLPQVLKLQTLEEAALLAEGWSYRGLVSNDPSISTRMPLALDPVPSGRVNPQVVSENSEHFRSLIREHEVVVALQSEQGYARATPSRRSFISFRAELEHYPATDVLCAYFGEPLGVFARTRDTLSGSEARTLVAQIEALAPDRIRCSAPR
jgi:mannosyltransferase